MAHDQRRRWFDVNVRVFIQILVCAACLGGLPTSAAQAESFSQWRKNFWPKAEAAGVDRRTFDRAFKGVSVDDWVLARTKSQPEVITPIWTYLKGPLEPSHQH